MNKTLKIAGISIIAASVLAGCAGTRTADVHKAVVGKTNTAVSDIVGYNTPNNVRTTVVNSQYISADYERYVPKNEGVINMSVGGGMTVTGAVQSVAAQGGYSLILASDIDPSVLRETLTLDLRNQSVEGALREIASAAGLVAIVDAQERKVTLANYATYTFRVPSSVFRTQDSTSSMTASPSGSGGGSSGGSSGSSGSNSSSSGMAATFSVSDSVKSNVEAMKTTIAKTAGEGSLVDIDPDTGLISVRAKATQLARVSRFLNDLAKDALMQVELQTSLVQVDINDDVEYGLDISKIVSEASNPWSFATNTVSSIANATGTGSYAHNGLTASLRALANIGKVTVLDQSTVVHKNHQASVFFNGRTRPYVPTVTTTQSRETGNTTSATVENAQDGISIGVVPHIINAQYVDLRLQPMLSQLGALERFNFAGSSASGYHARSTNMNLSLVLENGKTSVATQIINSRGETSAQGLPLLNRTALNALAGTDKSNIRQSRVLLLVYPRIIDAPKVNTLIGESL